MRKIKYVLFTIAIALYAGGCGGGGANSLFTAPPGSVEGYVYTASYNSTVAAARTAGGDAGRSAAAPPAGYTVVANATVAISVFKLTTTTDSNGYFHFPEVRASTVALTISKPGMNTLTVNVTVSEGRLANANNQQSNQAMSMAPSNHGTLTVTATTGSGAYAVPVKGAAVFIDYITTNKTTPATINDIVLRDPGATGYASYTVSVQAAGYNTVNILKAEITAGSPNAVLNFTLVPSDGNNPPYPTIALPADRQSFNFGTDVTLSGSAIDPEDGTLSGNSLVWTSDRDGQLGTGTALRKSNLSIGTHTITLTATDTGGKTGTATVTITVVDMGTAGAPPTPTILTPTNSTSYTNAQTIPFTGAATDKNNGVLNGSSLVWTSSRDGQLGTGTNFQRSGLSVGTHVITLTATDAYGAKGTANVTITINDANAVNKPPVAVIATPANGATATTNTRLTFSGTGIDPEDGNLTGSSIVWISNLRGQIGTGNFFTGTLTVGTHIITLTATDSRGRSSTASVTVIVSQSTTPNTAPTAIIATPINGTTATANTTLTFSGTGIDTEDGNLTGASLVWTSNHDGQIGTDNLITKKLSPGTHTITLTATDAQGLSGATSITVIISGTNSKPTVAILTPLAGVPLLSSQTVTFSGGATDLEDGTLTGDSLVWTSDPPLALPKGNFFQLKLNAGTYTITLTATDSNGGTAFATRILNVN